MEQHLCELLERFLHEHITKHTLNGDHRIGHLRREGLDLIVTFNLDNNQRDWRLTLEPPSR